MLRRKSVFFKIGLAAVLAVVGLVYIDRNWVDFFAYYSAGQSFLAGRDDLYSPQFSGGAIMDYRYPPFFLLLFLPIWVLPHSAAVYCWYWMNLAAIYFSGSVVGRGLKQIARAPVKIRLALLISFLAVFKYLLMGIRYGNIHLLIVCLLFGAFYLVLKRRDKTAGLLMALAITIKVFPIFTVPYFLIRKKWRFLAATVCFAVVFNLIPAFYFGFGANFKLLGDWYRHVVVESEFHEAQGPLNFSLKGQIERSFSQIDYTARIADAPYRNVNVLALPENQVTWLWKAAAAFFLIFTLFILWNSAKTKSDETADDNFSQLAFRQFSLMICAMLLVEPYTGTMYFTALFLPVATLVYSILAENSPSGKLNKIILGFIIFVNCLLPLIPGRDAQRLILIIGFDFYATLFLWLGLARDLLRNKSRCSQFEYQTANI